MKNNESSNISLGVLILSFRASKHSRGSIPLMVLLRKYIDGERVRFLLSSDIGLYTVCCFNISPVPYIINYYPHLMMHFKNSRYYVIV